MAIGALSRNTMAWPKLKSIYRHVVEVFSIWLDAEASTMGAAVAFYCIFAIAPLFILVLALAGAVFGHQSAQHELFGELQKLIGANGSQSIQSILNAANRPRASMFAAVIGFAALFIGASSVFIQLQQSLNAIWGVRVKSSGVRTFVVQRLLSFAALLGIGFLLLISLVVSAVLDAAGTWMSGVLPLHQFIWQVFNFVFSFGIVTLLFALIFKVLPDVIIAWRDVWIGAAVTALLFTIGKFLIGDYLGRSSVSSAYGAAGSFVVVLLWVYYSTQILLLGAASVRVYANRYGSHIRPSPHAEFIKKVQMRDKHRHLGKSSSLSS